VQSVEQACTYFSFFLIVPSVFNIHDDMSRERHTGKKERSGVPFFFSFLRGKRADAIVQIEFHSSFKQDGERNKYPGREGREL